MSRRAASSRRMLTRLFFDAFFDFGVLTESGSEAFVRTIIGVLSAIFVCGLFLTRLYAGKYHALYVTGTEATVRQALAADEMLVIALPMWIVAFVTVLVSHALIPDETDFRVLTPLPVNKGVIFGAKLSALGLFAGLFIVAGQLAVLLLTTLLAATSSAEHELVPHLAVHVAVSACGSLSALLAVISLDGAVLALAPRARAHAFSGSMRSAILCALVLALPFVGRLPAMANAVGQRSSALLWIPSAWFYGLERVLLGERDAMLVRLAGIALAAFALVAFTAAASYLHAYAHFDRSMLQSPPDRRPSVFTMMTRTLPQLSHPALAGVRAFVFATFGRSSLHHGVVVGLSACAIALVCNSLLSAGVLPWIAGSPPTRRLVEAAIWAPFALVCVMSVAVRMSMTLPIERRANWIFRVTEDDKVRRSELDAAAQAIAWLGIGLPVLAVLPLQILLEGPRVFPAPIVTVVCGLLFREILLLDWRRIPFTCSYLPGKRTVTFTVVTAFSAFVFFTTTGSMLALGSVRRPSAAAYVTVVLGVPIATMWWRRLREWNQVPLLFEDQFPDQPERLFNS
jgi:hypothetical protein